MKGKILTLEGTEQLKSATCLFRWLPGFVYILIPEVRLFRQNPKSNSTPTKEAWEGAERCWAAAHSTSHTCPFPSIPSVLFIEDSNKYQRNLLEETHFFDVILLNSNPSHAAYTYLKPHKNRPVFNQPTTRRLPKSVNVGNPHTFN
jgi:hypothetical protein